MSFADAVALTLQVFGPGARVLRPEPELRPYQREAIATLRRRVSEEGKTRLILVCPTGAGKSVIAAEIIRSAVSKGNRALFICHRKELVEQMVGHLARVGVVASVIRADDSRYDESAMVHVALVNTLMRRKLPAATLVFCDEVHLSASEGWRKILAHYTDSIVIGLTATPCRLDGKPLGDYFQELDVGATYSELIELNVQEPDKGIVEPRCFDARVPVDLRGIHTKQGDYDTGELGAVMSRPKILGSVIAEYQAHGEERSGIVFAVSIDHSQLLVREFLGAGISCEHVDGTTPEAEREDIWRRFESGATRVVCNVGIATTGFDSPRLKYLGLARPTQSLSLYMQMVGRALRPWKGIRPVVLDHGGNIERHGMPTEDRLWSLTSKPKRKAEKNEFKLCKACFAYTRAWPCESCGWMPEAKEAILPDVDEAVSLSEIATTTAPPTEEEKRAFFDRAVTKTRWNGWKAGAASAQFKEKYGTWPPWNWSQEAKRMIESDSEWLVKREANEARKRLQSEGDTPAWVEEVGRE